MTRSTPLFRRGHYNILAAVIRRELEKHDAPYITSEQKMHARNAVLDLALSLAKRLQEDNERFDPTKFLDACSPDPEQYPISELWEG